ncbi:hypothetical protein T484DRAFT_1901322 [Baffinella frigidus]|nr:hypothetical protein T484DRAFT_1901322 [Cryptophyta sp. CCMP2293]
MDLGGRGRGGTLLASIWLVATTRLPLSHAFHLPSALPRLPPRACTSHRGGALRLVGAEGRGMAKMSPEQWAKGKNAPVLTADWRFGETGQPYCEILDVRTPAEFAEDHLPGAINLPVLSNDQRVLVGTMYASSPFEGRKLGAGLIMETLSGYLKEHFAEKGKDYRPLVYCWRGGQRSGSLAHVLSEVGFRSSKLDGGYKTYRAEVQEYLKRDHKYRWCMLSGPTGSCKTRLLKRFGAAGHQVIDLEGLANHRGSVLGGMGDQPSQKAFEGTLAWALRDIDPTRPVWVESESANIGSVQLPYKVIDALRKAPRFEVALPFERRVAATLDEYEGLTQQPEHLKALLSKLKRFLGAKIFCEWEKLIDEGRWEELVADLLVQHYDPSYSRSQAAHREKHNPLVEKLPLPDWDEKSLDEAVVFMETHLQDSEGYRAAYPTHEALAEAEARL